MYAYVVIGSRVSSFWMKFDIFRFLVVLMERKKKAKRR